MKWESTLGPRMAKAVNEAVSELKREHGMFVELSGVVGGDEHRSTLWALLSGTTREDVAEAYNQIGEKYNWTATPGNYKAIIADIAAALPALRSNRPVTDKRETPEAVVIRQAETVAFKAELEANQTAWREEHCSGEAPVAIPVGLMAVYLEVTFDDSHSMTDYFAPHCQLGHDMLLGIVSKGPETQRVARSVLVRYPELNKLAWEWNTENYSMGHGNYLISDWFGEVEHQAYDGRTKVMTRYEIRMNAYTREMYAYKDYPGVGAAPAKTPEPGSNGNGITITENVEKDGIEIRFPGKPGEDVLDNLKANGWRWSRYNGCWYHRANEANRTFAQTVKA